MQLRSGKIVGSNQVKIEVSSNTTDTSNKESSKNSSITENWFFDNIREFMKKVSIIPSTTIERTEKYQAMLSMFSMINIHMEEVMIKNKFNFSILKIFSTIKTKLFELKNDCVSFIEKHNYCHNYFKNRPDLIKLSAIMKDLKYILNTCYKNMCELSDKHKVSQKLMDLINVKIVNK